MVMYSGEVFEGGEMNRILRSSASRPLIQCCSTLDFGFDLEFINQRVQHQSRKVIAVALTCVRSNERTVPVAFRVKWNEARASNFQGWDEDVKSLVLRR